jgi:hypothetical protein
MFEEIKAAPTGMQFEPTRPVFDLFNENRVVFDALSTHTPQVISEISHIRRRIPLPRNATPTIEGRFYRLPNHNRSFCYALLDPSSITDSPVLVFKGTEPLLNDFPTMLDWMAQAPLRRASRVMADHFPLAEGKIPGALSLKEALREAQIALQIQERHLLHYGELARLPTPVLVHSFSDHSRDVCASALRLRLSRAAFDRIEPLLDSGLAAYVYYYPAAPVRANYSGDMGSPQFRKFLASKIDEDLIIRGWVRLLVRLLYLGYLPYSVYNEGLGACMDIGNAALDGGFCDPDSIVEIDSSVDDEFFCEGIVQSFALLQNTVQFLLGLSHSGTLYASIEDFTCRRYLQHLIDEAIVSERRPGLHLETRFLELLAPRSLADVRLCTGRKNRAQMYAQFTKRYDLQIHAKSQGAAIYP